jgi:hypothetical protein
LKLAPADGVVIPANAPGVVADSAWGSTVPMLELFDSRGVSVASETSATEDPLVLGLEHSLTPGETYQVRAESQCLLGNSSELDGFADSEELSFTFGVGDPSPLPTTTGSVTVTYEAIVGRAQFPSGPEGYIVGAQLAVTPSPELVPFLPVTSFTTTIDGVHWATSTYGRGVEAGTLVMHGEVFGSYTSDLVSGAEDYSVIHAGCPGSVRFSTCHSGNAPSGKHHVQIQAHVAGAIVDPAPIDVDIDLVCPTEPPGEVNAGASAADSEATGSDSNDKSRTSEGCAVREPTRTSGRSGALMGLVLAFVALGVRSRRSLAASPLGERD